MSKRNKLRKSVEHQHKQETAAAPATPLSVGNHKFRVFQGIDAAFGARLSDYPPMGSAPKTAKPYEAVASGLFFSGGKLSDYGLSFKSGINAPQAMTILQALLSSFDPKHEHKEEAVAWCLSEWCDGTPTRKGGVA